MARFIRFALIPALTIVGASVPARAQGLLKQLQGEVAAIVTRARSAVVTVEDTRPIQDTLLRNYLYAVPDARRRTLEALKARLDRVASAQGAEAERRALQEQLSRLRAWEGSGVTLRPGEPAITFVDPTNPPKSGTGFSIGEGYVLTTADVLGGMISPSVVTDDGRRVKAAIVGLDTDLNVGLLKLQGKVDLPTLKLGDSSSVRVGHFAISIGNQSGQVNSAALALIGGIRAEGTVSGSHFYPGLIQIAGTVGAGVSGAPLLDADGAVIGVLAAVPAEDVAVFTTPAPGLAPGDLGQLPVAPPGAADSPSPQAQGERDFLPDLPLIGRLFRVGQTSQAPEQQNDPVYLYRTVPGTQQNRVFQYVPPGMPPAQAYLPVLRPPVTSAAFALPINALKPVVEALRAGRTVERSWLGVDLEDERRTTEENGVFQTTTRVKVRGVYEDSPAARAGLRSGDVLVRLNDGAVRGAADVRAAIQRQRPGDKISLVVERAGKPVTFAIPIEKRPAQVKPPQTTVPGAASPPR